MTIRVLPTAAAPRERAAERPAGCVAGEAFAKALRSQRPVSQQLASHRPAETGAKPGSTAGAKPGSKTGSKTGSADAAVAPRTEHASFPAQKPGTVMAWAQTPMAVAPQLADRGQQRNLSVMPGADATTAGLTSAGGGVMAADAAAVAEAINSDLADPVRAPTDSTVAPTTSSLTAALPGNNLPAAVAVALGQAGPATRSLATVSGDPAAFDSGVEAVRSTTRGVLTAGATQPLQAQAQAQAVGVPAPAASAATTAPAARAATTAAAVAATATAPTAPATTAVAATAAASTALASTATGVAANAGAATAGAAPVPASEAAVIDPDVTAYGRPSAGPAEAKVTSEVSTVDSATSTRGNPTQPAPSLSATTQSAAPQNTLTQSAPSKAAAKPGTGDETAVAAMGGGTGALTDGVSTGRTLLHGTTARSFDGRPESAGAAAEQPRPADQMPVDRTTPAALPPASSLSQAAPTTTAAMAATHAAPAQAAAAPPPVHSQVVAALTPVLHRRDGSYTVELQLDPASLGRVRVSVTLSGGEISVQMMAADHTARDLLRDNSEQLRHQLTQSGLDATSVDVGDDPRGTWQDPRGEQPTTYDADRHDRGLAGQPDSLAQAGAHSAHRPATGGNGPLDLHL